VLRNILPLFVLVTVVACGGGPPSAGGASRTGTITAAHIAGISAISAYDVVEKLRRGWLVSRGPNSFSDPSPAYPKVYLDDIEAGELYFLRTIGVSDIVEIRFLSTTESSLHYGHGHFGGVIQVITRP